MSWRAWIGPVVDRSLLAGILVFQVLIVARVYTQPSAGRRDEAQNRITAGLDRSATVRSGAAGHRGDRDAGVSRTGRGQTRAVPLESLFGLPLFPAEAMRVQRVNDHVDRMFEQAVRDLDRWGALIDMGTGWDAQLVAPALDMRHDGDSYVVVLSVPGVDADRVRVILEGRLLTIRVPFSGWAGQGRTGVLERKLLLPGPVAAGAPADARLDNGVLRVSIPKGRGGESPGMRLRLL